MRGRVVDASALAAVVFNEPDAELVAAVTAEWALLAPELLRFELASICRKKILATPERREAYLNALAAIEDLSIRCENSDLCKVTALALDLGITTYDAFYLNLSLESSVPLVTIDRDLSKVAERVLPQGHLLPRRH